MSRLPSLTSSRFFAALFVVAFHTLPFVGVTALVPFLRIGYTGVSFFFVLSGFVLTWGTARGSARSFYRRRFARIWPLCALVLVAWFAIDSARAGASTGQELARLVVALALLQAWVPHSEWYFGNNGVTWSLSAEAFFYSLTPWLLRRTLRRPLALLVVLVGTGIVAQVVLTVALPGNVEQWATYIAPAAGLVAFLSGHLLARAMRDGAIPRIPAVLTLGAPAGCLALGAWLVSYKVSHGSSPFFFMGGVAMLAVPGWLVLVAGLTRADEARRSPLASSPLVRLGEWSYALYLLHPIVLHFAGTTGYFRLGAPRVVLALGAWAAAVALSGLVYTLVERPAEDWLRGGRPDRPLPEDVVPPFVPEPARVAGS